VKRKICYVSGTRADFGLMSETLTAVHKSSSLSLSIIVTGMHLSEKYGNTVNDIEAVGLPIDARVHVDADTTNGAAMARNMGKMLTGFVDALLHLQPDLLLVLGDRGEMLAAALAAVHLNIPVVHIHGGERSGTIDESIRHAISKLAHFHFVATREARERLVRMGEQPENVHITGAPGLDGIEALATKNRRQLSLDIGFNPERPVALMIYHPVTQEAESAADGAFNILSALKKRGVQTIAIKPNSDAGSDGIRTLLELRANSADLHVLTHFPRASFVSWMAAADMMIGNSSAGIIEAASFGTPVVNVGTRQNLRERNKNVIDAGIDELSISSAIDQALKYGRLASDNIYGDGKTSARIVSLLKSLVLHPNILMKSNAY